MENQESKQVISNSGSWNVSVDSNGNYTFPKGDGTNYDLTEWYTTTYPGWYTYYYPIYPAWTEKVYVDSTQRAMEVVKELMEKKLLNIKTVKDFIDIVDIVRKKI